MTLSKTHARTTINILIDYKKRVFVDILNIIAIKYRSFRYKWAVNITVSTPTFHKLLLVSCKSGVYCLSWSTLSIYSAIRSENTSSSLEVLAVEMINLQ